MLTNGPYKLSAVNRNRDCVKC